MNWHLITCEYPPRVGGVADYTRLVARGLAAAGDEVHAWCPAGVGEAAASVEGVKVHGEMGRFRPSDLRRAGRALGRFKGPRRLLVQWVPHGYGWRSMNVCFCLWLCARRVLRGDEVTVVVHEPFLAFGEGTRRQDAVALVHRLMTTLLLAAARRVWVTIPKWEECLRPYALGRGLAFGWLPVPCTTPVVASDADADATRALYAPEGSKLVGHFGTYGAHVARTLGRVLPRLLAGRDDCAALLMGRGSEAMREELLRAHPRLSGRVRAAGTLAAEDLSRHLAACDLLLQPYPDGVSARRTSVMAGLAHGVAVVTTRGRLTEGVWGEGGAVALAEAGDDEGLLEEIRRVLTSSEERARLGAAGLKLYRERFDLVHAVAALRRESGGVVEDASTVGAGAEA